MAEFNAPTNTLDADTPELCICCRLHIHAACIRVTTGVDVCSCVSCRVDAGIHWIETSGYAVPGVLDLVDIDRLDMAGASDDIVGQLGSGNIRLGWDRVGLVPDRGPFYGLDAYNDDLAEYTALTDTWRRRLALRRSQTVDAARRHDTTADAA